MSEINSFSDYASKYNTNMDYSSLFGGGAPYIDNGRDQCVGLCHD